MKIPKLIKDFIKYIEEKKLYIDSDYKISQIKPKKKLNLDKIGLDNENLFRNFACKNQQIKELYLKKCADNKYPSYNNQLFDYFNKTELDNFCDLLMKNYKKKSYYIENIKYYFFLFSDSKKIN